ncbi:MAG: hypothetical protein KDD92_09090 [Caldilineaceae bacterium]|nr:hypothetical protein [Caldilineaceae bacterium]
MLQVRGSVVEFIANLRDAVGIRAGRPLVDIVDKHGRYSLGLSRRMAQYNGAAKQNDAQEKAFPINHK